ncbi:MAG: nitrilase-related carbon-nitrogen hydrolase [Candidatus Pelethousia sp.]|nr:nitrilase-related carbon-nitrogen hydrolase [Candidatus Pelethousia sp.]
MGRKARIALAQFGAKLGDVEANIKNAESLVAQAAAAGADVVLLPELCFSGYQLQMLGEKVHSIGDEWTKRIDAAMGKAAAAGKIYIVAGLCVPENGRYYNAAHLYDRKGQCVGEYHKAFSFGAEDNFFTKGDAFPVFDTDFGRIGILICYDIGFPETARYLCMAGAEIIFIPAAWRIEDEHAWHLNVGSRALENQVYTIAVNHVGTFGKLHLFGKSQICGPDGHPMLQLGYDEQMLGICDVDLDKATQMRRQPGYRVDLLASSAIQGDPRELCKDLD